MRKDCVNCEYVENGDILITSANGSSNLVGKHAIVHNVIQNQVVAGGFMLLGKTQRSDFINSSMSSNWYKKFINLYVAGGNGAIGNLSKSDLDAYNFLVPSVKEQEHIGALFKRIDTLITLHQRK